jgi:hypothetical protein
VAGPAPAFAPSLLRSRDDLLSPITSALSSLGAQINPGVGLMGLADLLQNGNDSAADLIRDKQDALTYQPTSPAAQRGYQTLAAAAPLVGKAKDALMSAGDDVMGTIPGLPYGSFSTAALAGGGLLAAHYYGNQ